MAISKRLLLRNYEITILSSGKSDFFYLLWSILYFLVLMITVLVAVAVLVARDAPSSLISSIVSIT